MKIIRYFFVGGISAAIDIGLFALFASYFHFPWAIVSIVSFIAVTFINYYLSLYFVFNSNVKFNSRFLIYGVFLISFIALLLNQILLYLFIEKMKIDLVVSKCLVTGIVFFWSYYGRKRFVFN
jgi:putative flippase GtrA